MNRKIIFYDFDGVMTDNKVFLSEDGKESVIVNRSDGLAISYFKKMNIKQIIISSETNPVVTKRAKKLKINSFQGIENKLDTIKSLIKKNKVQLSEVFFIGNDLNDLEVINFLPNSFCPKDSNAKVLDSSAIVLNKRGGNGVIMEFYEYLMENYFG